MPPDSDAVAIYGAASATVALVVGALSLGWQVFVWRRARRTSATFALFRAQVPHGELVVVSVFNSGERPVAIRAVGLGGESGSLVWGPPEGATIPGVVKPGEEALTTHALKFNGEHRLSLPATERVYAWAELASGARIKTAPRRLDELRLERHRVVLPMPRGFVPRPSSGEGVVRSW